MRLFLGLFPDDKTRAYLRDFRQRMVHYKRSLKFCEIDQMHITIKFLGNEVSQDTAHRYFEELRSNISDTKEFKYDFGSIEFGFPYQVTPNVLYLGVNESSEFDMLSSKATEVSKLFSSSELVTKQDRKKLIHHLTIARSKQSGSRAFARKLKKEFESFEVPDFESTAEAVTLVESKLTPQGPVYKRLGEIRFAKP